MKIGKFKISKTLAIVIIIILIIAGYYIVKSFLKNPAEGYITEKISKGQVTEEISETGSVKATEDLSLSFKGTGRIAKINVSSGQEVQKGEILAELDLSQIQAQLQSAQAQLSQAITQYEKSQSGSGIEDVNSAKQSLNTAYVSAQNSLNDAYTKIYSTYSFIIELQDAYFDPPYDIRNLTVQESKLEIASSMQKAKEFLNGSDVDAALSQMILSLENIKINLRIIREECDKKANYDTVPASARTTLDSHRTSIDTAISSVSSAQQTISSYKIALQKTQSGNTENADIYLLQINQAQANVNLYQSQLNDNYIRSPINGKVTEVNVKRGETVSPNQSIINLLSIEPFQIKVNIYEQDIVRVKIGNTAKIELVAFPKQIFEGKVVSIEPAEKIVDNVVYYEITIDFPQQPEGVRSGMTADVVVLASEKNDVLRVSKSAVESIDGKESVQLINRGKIELREIQTGLEGDDYYEVVSGLQEGEEIIIAKK
jgi:HlyD family secretion protein